MKIFAFILAIISLSKLCCILSIEKDDFIEKIVNSIKNDTDNVRKISTFMLVTEGFIGLVCSIIILFLQ